MGRNNNLTASNLHAENDNITAPLGLTPTNMIVTSLKKYWLTAVASLYVT